MYLRVKGSKKRNKRYLKHEIHKREIKGEEFIQVYCADPRWKGTPKFELRLDGKPSIFFYLLICLYTLLYISILVLLCHKFIAELFFKSKELFLLDFVKNDVDLCSLILILFVPLF